MACAARSSFWRGASIIRPSYIAGIQGESMRTPIIAGNWKMNKNVAEAVELARALRAATADVEKVEMVVCPPFVSLTAVKDALAGSKIGVGAQNMYWEEKGAFTGEISPPMLKDLVTYVIIG